MVEQIKSGRINGRASKGSERITACSLHAFVSNLMKRNSNFDDQKPLGHLCEFWNALVIVEINYPFDDLLKTPRVSQCCRLHCSRVVCRTDLGHANIIKPTGAVDSD